MPFVLCVLLTLPLPIQSQTRFQDISVAPSVTRLEAFQSRTGTVIIRAFSVAGFVRGSGGEGSMRVEYDVLTDSTTGEKEYGIILRVNPGTQPDRGSNSYIDYDEIQPLLRSIEHLSAATTSITDLPTFEATHRSKGGLVITKYVDRGGVNYIRVSSIFVTPAGALAQSTVSLNPVIFNELGTLIEAAKTRLDQIRQAR
jgi:hypothetical protein